MAAPTCAEVLHLGPELTIAHADGHRQAMLGALNAADAAPPALDLAGVTACDTAGVQLLLAWRASLAERGWPMRVDAASPEVTDALALYGLGELLAAEPAEGCTT